MKAKVIHTNSIDGAETIEVNGHQIQYGYGNGGDGYCHEHQSFDCIDNLSAEEKQAVQEAE